MRSCEGHGGHRPASSDAGDAPSGAPRAVWRVLRPLEPENFSACVPGYLSLFQSGFEPQAAVKQKPEVAPDVGRRSAAPLFLGAMNGRLFLAVLSLSLLAGCVARKGPPAPIVQATGAAPASMPATMPATSAPVAVRVAAPADSHITVRQNESLYAVAQRANVPVRSLIDANNLKPPYAVSGGQRLTVPSQQTYQVRPGDTLAAIARRHGLGTNELVRANALAPPYAVKAGQMLTLPSGAPEPVVAGVTLNPASSLATPPPSPPASVVAAAPSVERAPRGTVESAALPPPPVTPASAVPAAPAAAPVASLSPPPAATAVASMPPPVPVASPPSPVQPASLPVPASPLSRADDDDEPAAHPSSRGFLWPVRGNVISDYGAKPGGTQNDGINIAAPRGASIRAAEAGSVVYAGNELKGFGNLLLVRHKDGWITAYAHADELLVKRGDDVVRGQTIAKVGATGGVGTPQLHFEIRRGSRPLNPRDYLAPLTASAMP